jgi:hypothetical protein
LRIETYFSQIRDLIEGCPVIQSSSVSYDKRSTHEGFLHGELYLIDGSTLHVREFVDVETAVDRLMYVYQYLDAAQTLVFRYDNTGHHGKLDLPTHPHHKHEGKEDNIIAAAAPGLAAVLDEVESLACLES